MSDERGIAVCAAGDVWFADHPVCVGFGVRSASARGADYLFSQVAPALRSADIALCNLECPLSDAGKISWKLASMEARGRPSGAGALRRAGFGVVNVANNHAMHHGGEAFADTVRGLEAAGVAVLGCEGERGTRPVEMTIRGRRVALLGFSMRPEERASGALPYSLRQDEDLILDEIAQIRGRCDLLIVSLHWGLEFLSLPSPAQVRFARRLAEAGVDLVIGHHSHTLQPIVRYGRCLVLYSTGNLVFDLWGEAMRRTALVSVELHPDREPAYRFDALRINRRYQPEAAAGEAREAIGRDLVWSEADLDRALAGVGDGEYLERYRRARRQFRHESYRYFARNLYRVPPHFTAQSLGRTLMRRLRGD